MMASHWLLLAFLVPGVLALVPHDAGVAGETGRDLPELDAPELGVALGQAHPDFALPDLEGGHRRLSDLRGRRLLLFHFASW